jgi:hypothetical protein
VVISIAHKLAPQHPDADLIQLGQEAADIAQFLSMVDDGLAKIPEVQHDELNLRHAELLERSRPRRRGRSKGFGPKRGRCCGVVGASFILTRTWITLPISTT